MTNSSTQSYSSFRPADAADSSESKRTLWFLSGRIEANGNIQHVPIHSSPFLIGRRTDLDLSLTSKMVSNIHANIVENETSILLRDVGSTNGTYVNGERVADTVELAEEDLIQFGDLVFRVLRHSPDVNTATVSDNVCDVAMSLVQLDKLMNERAVIPHYQPIIDLCDDRVIGFEVLGRSRIPGMETPAAMFSAAAKLNLEEQLSQIFRWKALQETMALAEPPHLFLNTHPTELQSPDLLDSMHAIRETAPNQEITLEIHEAAVTDASEMNRLRSGLREINIGLAFDDFGAGQARLVELSSVHPDYLKFDMSLIRCIHQSTSDHRQLVSTLVRLVRDLGVIALAEGIESIEEADTCRELGFQLAQGFLFGKPTRL